MNKILATASILALAGAASAAPFTVASALIFAEGGLTDGSIAPFGGASLAGQQTAGVFYDNDAFGNAGAETGSVVGANLLGAHPGGFPMSGLPQTASLAGNSEIFIAPIAGNGFDGAGDNSWNVGFNISDSADDVPSAPGAFANDVWIGRISGTNITIGNLQANVNRAGSGTFELDGPGVDFGGQLIFAKSVPVGENSFDIILTDAPAPGAAALLGLAGFAGLRRRRA